MEASMSNEQLAQSCTRMQGQILMLQTLLADLETEGGTLRRQQRLLKERIAWSEEALAAAPPPPEASPQAPQAPVVAAQAPAAPQAAVPALPAASGVPRELSLRLDGWAAELRWLGEAPRFEVQQLSEGVGGRVRMRSVQCEQPKCTVDCVEGKAYVFQVRAQTAGGWSDFSVPVSLGNATALLAKVGKKEKESRDLELEQLKAQEATMQAAVQAAELKAMEAEETAQAAQAAGAIAQERVEEMRQAMLAERKVLQEEAQRYQEEMKQALLAERQASQEEGQMHQEELKQALLAERQASQEEAQRCEETKQALLTAKQASQEEAQRCEEMKQALLAERQASQDEAQTCQEMQQALLAERKTSQEEVQMHKQLLEANEANHQMYQRLREAHEKQGRELELLKEELGQRKVEEALIKELRDREVQLREGELKALQELEEWKDKAQVAESEVQSKELQLSELQADRAENARLRSELLELVKSEQAERAKVEKEWQIRLVEQQARARTELEMWKQEEQQSLQSQLAQLRQQHEAQQSADKAEQAVEKAERLRRFQEELTHLKAQNALEVERLKEALAQQVQVPAHVQVPQVPLEKVQPESVYAPPAQAQLVQAPEPQPVRALPQPQAQPEMPFHSQPVELMEPRITRPSENPMDKWMSKILQAAPAQSTPAQAQTVAPAAPTPAPAQPPAPAPAPAHAVQPVAQPALSAAQPGLGRVLEVPVQGAAAMRALQAHVPISMDTRPVEPVARMGQAAQAPMAMEPMRGRPLERVDALGPTVMELQPWHSRQIEPETQERLVDERVVVNMARLGNLSQLSYSSPLSPISPEGCGGYGYDSELPPPPRSAPASREVPRPVQPVVAPNGAFTLSLLTSENRWESFHFTGPLESLRAQARDFLQQRRLKVQLCEGLVEKMRQMLVQNQRQGSADIVDLI